MDFAAETALLTSDEAGQLLQAALTGDPEVVLPGFTARLDDLHYRPGAEVTAVYTASYAADGTTHTEHLLATTADVTGQVATLTRDGITLRVWRHPGDPRLPGLAAACDPDTVLGWLGEAGIPSPALLALDLLTYRPLRRAVLRARADETEFYLKVLRQGHDDRLAERQDALARVGLAVPVLARPMAGVLVSPRTPGTALADILAGGGAADPSELIGLLDRLPGSLLRLPRRPSWSERLEFHAATARQQQPSQATRIDATVAAVGAVLAEQRHGPVVATHGDCYELNIFVAEDGWQFIDVDSAGPGLREADLACALAHLAVLPVLDPAGWAGIPAVVEQWRAAFVETVDAADLYARTAAVLVSLVASVPSGVGPSVLEVAERYAGEATGLLPSARR